jgi:hypothetical protein
LALQKEGPPVLLEEGVFDTVTLLGTHSDKIIRFSCQAVMALLSPLLTGVRKGTLSKVIALCLNDDQVSDRQQSSEDELNLLGEPIIDDSSTRPIPPKEACHERPGTWAKSRKAFSFDIFAQMPSPAPQETPFTSLSQNFRAPKWEKVHFASLKQKPELPLPPAVVKPETSQISISAKASTDVNITVGSGPAAEDVDRMEFTKDEPVVDACWDDEAVATNHQRILKQRRNDRLSEFGVNMEAKEVKTKSGGASSGGGVKMPKIGKGFGKLRAKMR